MGQSYLHWPAFVCALNLSSGWALPQPASWLVAKQLASSLLSPRPRLLLRAFCLQQSPGLGHRVSWMPPHDRNITCAPPKLSQACHTLLHSASPFCLSARPAFHLTLARKSPSPVNTALGRTCHLSPSCLGVCLYCRAELR